MKALPRIAVVLAVFGAATLYADDAPKADGKDKAPAPAPPKKKKELTIPEMQTGAVQINTQIQDDNRHVIALKDRAKKQKDVIKLNCVNDRLVQVKVQMNIADTTNTSLQSALSSNSNDRHAIYGQLVDVGEGVRRLREEANGCAGEPELFKQESGVVVSHPPITDDPSAVDPFLVEVEPPGYASPFN